jgi:hypothetical protein
MAWLWKILRSFVWPTVIFFIVVQKFQNTNILFAVICAAMIGGSIADMAWPADFSREPRAIDYDIPELKRAQ